MSWSWLANSSSSISDNYEKWSPRRCRTSATFSSSTSSYVYTRRHRRQPRRVRKQRAKYYSDYTDDTEANTNNVISDKVVGNWEKMDKKKFLHFVSMLPIEDFFEVIIKDKVYTKSGAKKWMLDDFILQRKDRRMCVGGQGSVLFVRRKGHSTSLAMKVCLHCRDQQRIERYARKTVIQTRCHNSSPFISKILTCFLTHRFFVTVMYKAKYSSLKTLKKQLGKFPVTYIKYYTSCMVSAMCELHNRDICHRDIKADNVLVDHNGLPQLADFGLAVDADKDHEYYYTSHRATTMMYYPPETLVPNRKVNDYKLDVWLLGFLLCELSIESARHLWNKFKKSNHKNWKFITCSDCHLPSSEANNVKSLLKRLLQPDPKNRPAISTTSIHPFFEGFEPDSVADQTPLDIAKLFSKLSSSGDTKHTSRSMYGYSESGKSGKQKR